MKNSETRYCWVLYDGRPGFEKIGVGVEVGDGFINPGPITLSSEFVSNSAGRKRLITKRERIINDLKHKDVHIRRQNYDKTFTLVKGK